MKLFIKSKLPTTEKQIEVFHPDTILWGGWEIESLIVRLCKIDGKKIGFSQIKEMDIYDFIYIVDCIKLIPPPKQN